ncbi:c-type cytochrome [Lutibaculum baratangense]|uniref:Sulfite dehydrogenase cytochrome subunit SoxD n=1 Tax=Lutibaculum baratangense AMV1 TaxID=631454 RepID=V4RPQ7_9HYPH|nr:c-type cytochrome [Lutibaculum baratangense]ESR27264.1 Sulfite dehydrogenase cytochrome subunit SoxD [Lutibaculum baratangense AMV1]
MSKSRKSLLAAAAASLLALPAHAQGDPDNGAQVFKKCLACHAVGENAKHKVGPHLNDLFGRTAGGLGDYKYSNAMHEAGENGLVWEDETLHDYLADPRGAVKGTKMAFAGLKKEDELRDVVAYLRTFSSEDAAATGASPVSGQEPEPTPQSDAPDVAATEPAAAQAVAAAGGTATEPGVGLAYGLGRRATEDEVAAWDIDVRPDGMGLPDGSGTVGEGDMLFQEQCASCHGVFGEGAGRWPVLAGGQGTLTDERPEKTIGSFWPYLSTVFDYIRRAMPFGNAHSLTDDEVYALTAYLLYMNDVVADEEFELSKENFSEIELPNAANFIDDDRDSEPHYAAKADPCMRDCKDTPAEIVMRARILDVTPGSVDDDGAGAGAVD